MHGRVGQRDRDIKRQWVCEAGRATPVAAESRDSAPAKRERHRVIARIDPSALHSVRGDRIAGSSESKGVPTVLPNGEHVLVSFQRGSPAHNRDRLRLVVEATFAVSIETFERLPERARKNPSRAYLGANRSGDPRQNNDAKSLHSCSLQEISRYSSIDPNQWFCDENLRANRKSTVPQNLCGCTQPHPRYNPLVPSEQQFFQEDEAEQILLLAARRSASGAMSREQLLAAAAEAGISPEAVQEAETEYRERSAEVKERLHYDKHVKHEFWTHLSTYLLVNTGLVFLDLRGDGGLDWAYWPVIGWGLGMIAHAWMTFAKGSDDYEKEFRRWRAKKSLRESGVIDDVAAGIIAGVGLGSMGTTLSEDALNRSSRAARRALRQERKAHIEQRKLEAIEHLRAKTGLSLPEAKQVVEEYLEEIEE